MLEIIAYLEHDHEHADVLAFILTIQDKLEAATFCPEDARPKFVTRLNKAWKAYQLNNGISPTPVKQQEQLEADAVDPAPSEEVEGENKFAGTKKRDTKKASQIVYAAWNCSI
jgi:hypothetical protein